MNEQAESGAAHSASATGDSTQSATRQGRRAPKKRRVKTGCLIWLLVIALVAIAVPAVAFSVAYSKARIPEPGELQNAQISTIFAGDGKTELARLVPPEGNRKQITLDKIPDHVETAVLAAEDREFWTNSGFSVTGFGRAVIGQLTGNDSAGGGSTITQQYVKNTLVGDERSYERKARELVYSVKMTNEWPKEQILNAYLNTVYFGRNAYGIESAANAYFNKPASKLTVSEGAMLAGLIQTPSQLDPWVNKQQSVDRWNYVMDGLVEMGEIDAAERSKQKFPQTRNPAKYSAYTEATGPNGLIKNRVIDELEHIGITEDDVTNKGLQITTTIDMKVQNATLEAVRANLDPLQDDARAASVSIDPATGAVRGYYGGDEAGGWDYANAPMQTGSTFKIMALAAALQQGISLDTGYSSAPVTLPGNITVSNVAGFDCGFCSIRDALKYSHNTSFIRLQDDLKNTMQDTADMAHSLGVADTLPSIEKTLTENGNTPYEGIVLGQYPSRPVDMATAMATLTNKGVWNETHFVQKVETGTGEVLFERPEPEGQRRVAETVAGNVLEAMKPIAAYSNGALADGRESAAKTGTSQLGDTGNNRDAWMVGSTPQLASAVWVGTADNASAIFNQWGGIMYGSQAPTQIWKQTLDASLAGQEMLTFDPAKPVRYGTGTYGGGYVDPNYVPEVAAPAEDAPAEEDPTEEAPAEEQRTPRSNRGDSGNSGNSNRGNSGGNSGNGGGNSGGNSGNGGGNTGGGNGGGAVEQDIEDLINEFLQ